MPGSLLVQARAALWAQLRRSEGGGGRYTARVQSLVTTEELPLILAEYLQCIA